MASPSKNPAFTPILPEDGPMVLATPQPTSPNPPDNIDEMLDAGRMGSGEDSPTSTRVKRSRGEGGVTDDDTPLKRHRSTEAHGTRSGSDTRPEDPAQIVDDEDNDVDVETEEGDIPAINLAGVHTRPLSFFHDSRIILDSVCTSDTLT